MKWADKLCYYAITMDVIHSKINFAWLSNLMSRINKLYFSCFFPVGSWRIFQQLIIDFSLLKALF